MLLDWNVWISVGLIIKCFKENLTQTNCIRIGEKLWYERKVYVFLIIFQYVLPTQLENLKKWLDATTPYSLRWYGENRTYECDEKEFKEITFETDYSFWQVTIPIALVYFNIYSPFERPWQRYSCVSYFNKTMFHCLLLMLRVFYHGFTLFGRLAKQTNCRKNRNERRDMTDTQYTYTEWGWKIPLYKSVHWNIHTRSRIICTNDSFLLQNAQWWSMGQ